MRKNYEKTFFLTHQLKSLAITDLDTILIFFLPFFLLRYFCVKLKAITTRACTTCFSLVRSSKLKDVTYSSNSINKNLCNYNMKQTKHQLFKFNTRTCI